jgi:AcrR family transcriptional regulator
MTTTTLERTRIDPRVTRTRKLLRDALASLLADKNFESLSVQDIAAAATVNRATFYAHFTDKFDLLDSMIRDDVATHLGQGDPLSRPDARALLLGVGKNVFTFVGTHRRCKIDRDFDPQMQRSLETQLREFLLVRFPHCAAMVIAAALVGAAMDWRYRSPNEPFDPIVTNMVDILVDGVAERMLRHPVQPSATHRHHLGVME